MKAVHSLFRWGLPIGAGLVLMGPVQPISAQDAPPQPRPAPFQIPSLTVSPKETRPTAPPRPQPMWRGPDGKMHPITDNAKPQQQVKRAMPQLVEGQALGSEGVKKGQASVRPFGSKGEWSGVNFRAGFFVPKEGEHIQPTLMKLAAQRASNIESSLQTGNGKAGKASVYGLIVLQGRLDAGLKAQLQAAGVELLGYYPNTAWKARIPVEALQAVSQMPGVRWIGQPNATQKIAAELMPTLNQVAQTREVAKALSVYVHLFGPDAGAERAALVAAGATIHMYDAPLNILELDVPVSAIGTMVNMDSVLYIEPVLVFHSMDATSMPTINADMMWGVYDPAANNGATQVKVGITDTGWYLYHNDFSNVSPGSNYGYSLISGENWYDDLEGHGTFCSGITIGEGNANSMYRGVAAGLTSHGDGANNPDYMCAQVLDKTGFSQGNSVYQGFQAVNGEFSAGFQRQVFNCSLGGGVTDSNGNPIAPFLVGTDGLSIKIDQLFQNNVLPVIAAGNSGGAGSGSIASPGAAKGALTVGAVTDNYVFGYIPDQIAPYSSRGPTGDNRVKPDVVAPGSYIDSVQSRTASSYSYNGQGTSFATPHVTGLAAGLFGHYPGIPAWAVKSVIIAGALDLGYSSNDQGRGKADALTANSKYIVDGGWNYVWWSGNGGDGDVEYRDFSLGSSVAQLKIVLDYPDAPPSGGAGIALVNDLDLGLQYGSLTTDWSRNWTSESSYDPVEVITVANAPAGNYRIKIHSYHVPTGSQAWAVAWGTSSATTPNVSPSVSAPYAVQPSSNFYADASAYNSRYVATGVDGVISLGSGLSNVGMVYERNSAGGLESFYFPNPDPGTAGAYNPADQNMGDIAAGYTRDIAWYLQAGTTEGTQPISFYTFPTNPGTSYSVASTNVIIDGTAPTIATPEGRNWTPALATDVVVNTQDVLSGLRVGTAYYQASNDGGATWFVPWTNTSSTGSNTTTAVQTITAPGIAYGQNDPTKNKIQFYIVDMAGNFVYSPIYSVSTGKATNLALGTHTIAGYYGFYNTTGTVTLSAAAPTGGATVTLTSSNTSAATVLASVTVAAHATTATFPVTVATPATDQTTTITATYGGGSASSKLKVLAPVSITGKIILDSVVNSVQTMNFQFRPTDGSATLPGSQTLAADGTYTWTFPAMKFNMWVKGDKWLGEILSVDGTHGNLTNQNLFLPGGDADNSNNVDIADFSILVPVYPSTLGDGTYDERADFTCDGKVDIADFGVLVSNYGSAGQP